MAGDFVEVGATSAPPPGGNAAFGPDAAQIPAASYEKLRRLAAEYLRTERPDHTLQATALLHEAFLRVLKRPDHAWRNEAHIIAFAARAMRQPQFGLPLCFISHCAGSRGSLVLIISETNG